MPEDLPEDAQWERLYRMNLELAKRSQRRQAPWSTADLDEGRGSLVLEITPFVKVRVSAGLNGQYDVRAWDSQISKPIYPFYLDKPYPNLGYTESPSEALSMAEAFAARIHKYLMGLPKVDKRWWEG